MSYTYFLNPHVDIVYEVLIQDGAIERFNNIGWTEVAKPENDDFISSDAENLTFVRLWYLAMRVHHDYPNRAEVLAGALEAGWTYPT